MSRCVPVVVAVALLTPGARPATFHVAPDKGDDSSPGSQEKPWKTVAKATKGIRPGDTVVLHGGIYRGEGFHFGPAGPDAQARTVFKAAAGERVLLTRDDGTVPAFSLADYVRVEGLWVGGKWTKEEKQPIFAVGGSPIGRGKQLVGCTVFGYTGGILVGSSENLLIQRCRIVHCGSGRFAHGCYLSGGYTRGAMTQHVVLDDNIFVAGEGYAIHGWHNPHSCVVTRNFVSSHFWDLVLSGSDHLVAHNTLWRNTGQKGREPGWNAWLPAERVVFVNNVLNSAIPIFGNPSKESTVSHNAYLSAAPHKADRKPFDLRKRAKAVDAWMKTIDEAVARIGRAFYQPADRLYADAEVEKAFAALREPPPQASGLRGAGLDVGLLPAKAKRDVGRTVATPPDFWDSFKRLKLRDFDREGRAAP